jgi:glycine reductase
LETSKKPIRVAHYVNQFFAGRGGEEIANAPVEVVAAALGPARLLEQILGADGQVVGTIFGGDNYVSERPSDAERSLKEAIQSLRPDLLLAGPAFDAGRYGLACALASRVARELAIPAVTAMHPENPGVVAPHGDALIVPTGTSASQMRPALEAMARLGLTLARGEQLGPAAEEGYLPRGIRRPGLRSAPGHRRAVDLLEARLAGQAFQTELPIRRAERIRPAAPLPDLRRATIALVTTGGLVPKGNPDRLVAASATQYLRYKVAGLPALAAADWDCVHRGFYTVIVKQNPNYILPLDVVYELASQGKIGGVHPWIFTTSGVGTADRESRQMGREIGRELREAHVDGVLLVAT